jgi:polyisoprenoid-binding protein YceI
MMKKFILAFIIGNLSSFTAVAANSYTVDPRHTFPSFEINHLGFSTQRGRFNQTTGKVLLEPEAARGRIQIAIVTASISTGFTELEKHLLSKEFLDAASHPLITFISDNLSFNKDQLIAADGILTLHGVSKPVHLTVDHFYCGMNMITLKNTCGANATTTIKRSDFGIDKYVPAIADEVNIAIQIEATKN